MAATGNAALHCMVTRGIVQRWVDRLVDLPLAYPVSAVVTGSTGPENSEGPYFFMCPCTAGPARGAIGHHGVHMWSFWGCCDVRWVQVRVCRLPPVCS